MTLLESSKRACKLVVAIQLVRAALHPFTSAPTALGPDGPTYLSMARAVAGAGFPWADMGNYYQGALYTLLMSQVVRVWDSITLLRVINAALFGLVLLLSWRLVRGVFGRTAAWVAITTLSLEQVSLFGKYLQYEMLLLVLLFEGMHLIDRSLRRGSLTAAAFAGLALGLACLTQLKTVALVGALMAWIAVFGARAYRRDLRAVLAATLVCATCATAPLVFWAARNHALYGRFTVSTTGGGVHFFLSNNPHADGGFTYPPGFQQYDGTHQDGWALDREYYRKGWAFIRENPGRFLALIPRKWAALFELERFRGWAALLMACAGAWCLGRRALTRRCGLLVVPLLVTVALHVLFLGGGRYRFPALAGQHALAAVGVIALVNAINKRPASPGR